MEIEDICEKLKKVTIAANPELARRPDQIRAGEIVQLDIPAPVPSSVGFKENPTAASRAPAVDGSMPEKSTKSETLSDQKSIFQVSPRFSYNRIDATDRESGGKSTVSSDGAPGFELSWIQVWSKNWQTHVDLAYDHFSEKTSGKMLHQNGFSDGTFGMFAERSVFANGRAQFGALVDNEPFLRADSSSSLILETTPILSLQGGISDELIRYGLFAFSAGGSVALRFPSAQDLYRVQLGYDYKLYLRLEQLHGKLPLFFELFFQQLSQNT